MASRFSDLITLMRTRTSACILRNNQSRLSEKRGFPARRMGVPTYGWMVLLMVRSHRKNGWWLEGYQIITGNPRKPSNIWETCSKWPKVLENLGLTMPISLASLVLLVVPSFWSHTHMVIFLDGDGFANTFLGRLMQENRFSRAVHVLFASETPQFNFFFVNETNQL